MIIIFEIFYDFSTIKTLQNQLDALLLIEVFPTIPRIQRQEVIWFGRSQHDKQNKTKQTKKTFLHR
jgi:hypothetical protein